MSVAQASEPGAIEVTGTAQHAAWAARTLPPVERLAGGLWSIPVPIPDNPLRYTLTYLIPGDRDQLVVVDPGWDDPQTWDALVAGLAQAGAEPTDITGIVATHVHPDHHGLSKKLREASGAWIAMHPAEAETMPHRLMALAAASGGGDRAPQNWAQHWLAVSGAPDEESALLLGSFGDGPKSRRPRLDMADPDVLLSDGDQVPLPGRRLIAVWTPGHTPGHICLREPDAKLMLTGDHVLPRITPNIGMSPGVDAPVLAEFVDSLEKLAQYDDHDALPAHEYRFRGLRNRVRQLQDHHEERCQEIATVVDDLGDPTLWQLAERLTWSRGWAEIGAMRFAAIAETTAHVRYLVDAGRLAWTAPPKAGDPTPLRLRAA